MMKYMMELCEVQYVGITSLPLGEDFWGKRPKKSEVPKSEGLYHNTVNYKYERNVMWIRLDNDNGEEK